MCVLSGVIIGIWIVVLIVYLIIDMKEIRNLLVSMGVMLILIIIDIILSASVDFKSESFAYLCLGGFIYLYVKHSKHFD